ncbi:MAG TPA: hypothetical protein VFJ57_08065 [Solirubrobacterales bacterium]|nr:hypothetical protein [Solirubrobacterales bacterium]
MAISLAVTAASAQAASFLATSYPATLTGTPIEESSHVIQFEGERKITCTSLTFTGTLAAASTSETLTPEYKTCHASLLGEKLDATVATNGCDFLFTEPSGKEGTYTGAVNLNCPEGKSVEIRVYDGIGVPHTEAEEDCRYTIKAQSGLTGVEHVNMAGPPADTTVFMGLSKLAYTRAFGTKALCGGESSTSTYTGNLTLQAGGTAGTLIGKPRNFTASAYPAVLSGSPIEGVSYEFQFEGERRVTCKAVTFSGELAAVSNSLTITPEYKECVASILGEEVDATVINNVCKLVLDEPSSQEGSATGAINFSCTGKGIEVQIFKGLGVPHVEQKCRYLIQASQSNLSDVGYENVGSDFRANFSVSNLAFTRTAGTEAECGKVKSTGKYSGSSTVSAKNSTAESISTDVNLPATPQSGKFTAAKYPATLTGTTPTGEYHTFEFEGGRKVTCLQPTFAGEMKEASSVVTLTPTYGTCHGLTAETKRDATVTMNECSYVAAVETGIADFYSGPTKLTCPVGKSPEIHIYLAGATHSPAFEICRYTMGLEIGTLDYENLTAASPATKITATWTAGAWSYTRSLGSEGNCGKASGTAKYTGRATLSAKNEKAEAVGLDIG